MPGILSGHRSGTPFQTVSNLDFSLWFNHEEFCDEHTVHRKTFALTVFAGLEAPSIGWQLFRT